MVQYILISLRITLVVHATVSQNLYRPDTCQGGWVGDYLKKIKKFIHHFTCMSSLYRSCEIVACTVNSILSLISCVNGNLGLECKRVVIKNTSEWGGKNSRSNYILETEKVENHCNFKILIRLIFRTLNITPH